MDVDFSHASLFLAGRYRKFARGLSQTPWLIDGERKSASSVEEELVRIIGTEVKSDKVRTEGYSVSKGEANGSDHSLRLFSCHLGEKMWMFACWEMADRLHW